MKLENTPSAVAGHAPSPEASGPPAHALAAADLVTRMGVDPRRGLAPGEVESRRSTYGQNELASAPPPPWWHRLLAQFRDLVVWILLVAAVIAGVTGDIVDTIAILAIVILNGAIGYLQEARAEKALAALQKLTVPMAKALRNGELTRLAARELVPGDIVEIEAGDNVPADARLIETYGLKVQEASLTGESLPVEKQAGAHLESETPLGDRRNMVYMSTVASSGKGRAVVTATGMQTELGRIAGLLQHGGNDPTPLQRRLAELGHILVYVCLAIVAVIFALDLLRGEQLMDVFVRAVSLAVAAVPEGLPAVVTLTLALGLQRMVARNVLIRRLPSVETLGSVTVVCSDKTGTLTRNEMTVRVVVAGGEWYRISGTGYAPVGQFHRVEPGTEGPGDAPGRPPVDPRESAHLTRALTVAVKCNNARLVPPAEGSGTHSIVGDPTEGALLVAALKAGLEGRNAHEQVAMEIPFDSDRKTMSIAYHAGSGAIMFTKGAPEVVLANCTHEQRDGALHPLTEARKNEINSWNSRLASEALRVLALAYREFASPAGPFEETQMVFAGLVGMIDPPRDEVRAAVARCRTAGIRPVMITGDHPQTAAAIARELAIVTGSDRTIAGSELDRLSDEELARQVDRISVYARVSPEHKLRVVRAWKSRGDVVAMTGDGVNDAPAVHAADIGIAMGITGTDVTKESSDMVLTDDNFTSIVNAVEEGRGIFDNIQKFIHYLLSCNAGEVLLMLFAAIAGWPAPLAAIQILWINLVTDGLPALALAMERPERDIMHRAPRPPREPVITAARGLLIAFHGTLIAAAAAAGFAWIYYGEQGGEESIDRARTVAFCIMSYSQLFFAIGCRSHTRTLPQLGPFSNLHLLGAIVVSGSLQLLVVLLPAAQRVFETTGHSHADWVTVIGLSLVPVSVIETVKLVRWGFRSHPK